jgi:hypothetical protein
MLAAALFLLAGAAPADGAPAWEKVYERPEKDGSLEALWADEAGWFAAGPGLLVAGGAGGVQPLPQGERTIVGFSGASRAELFAVGWNELVLKLDGSKWIEEHFVAGPPPRKRGRKVDDLLLRVDTLPVDGKPMPAAVGVWQVLVRHPDGTWQALPEAARREVLMLAHQGPKSVRPERCTLAAWQWVGKDRALFSCHDDRTFLFEAGKATPAGRLPRACKQGLDRPRVRGADRYTLCHGDLWRSDGTAWKRIPTPAKLRDIALTDRCLYAATQREVWRRCQGSAK